jgi:hypothetical protein
VSCNDDVDAMVPSILFCFFFPLQPFFFGFTLLFVEYVLDPICHHPFPPHLIVYSPSFSVAVRKILSNFRSIKSTKRTTRGPTTDTSISPSSYSGQSPSDVSRKLLDSSATSCALDSIIPLDPHAGSQRQPVSLSQYQAQKSEHRPAAHAGEWLDEL